MEDNEFNLEEFDEVEDSSDKDDNVIITKIIDVDDLTYKFKKEEIENYSKYAILSYIGFLFLIPILNKSYKKSKYLLFHVNQGFNLFALELFTFIVMGLINSIFISILDKTPFWLSIINFILYSLIVILMLSGIVNVVNGKSKELPIIGKLNFIK